MQVRCFTTLNKLAAYADDWERLAEGMPFRSWTWLQHWWRHYGREESSGSDLAVLCAFDAKQLVGIAPWHFENAALGGRVLRPLGTGEVCSDYLGVFCQPGREDAVAGALADYLVANALDDDPHALHWDLLHLDAVDADDRFMPLLAHYLAVSGCSVNRRPGANCWRLDLPADWDAYLASLGKNLRRDLRRLDRDYIETNRAVLHRVERLEELPRAMDILVELHQRRRNKLGEADWFRSKRRIAACKLNATASRASHLPSTTEQRHIRRIGAGAVARLEKLGRKRPARLRRVVPVGRPAGRLLPAKGLSRFPSPRRSYAES